VHKEFGEAEGPSGPSERARVSSGVRGWQICKTLLQTGNAPEQSGTTLQQTGILLLQTGCAVLQTGSSPVQTRKTLWQTGFPDPPSCPFALSNELSQLQTGSALLQVSCGRLTSCKTLLQTFKTPASRNFIDERRLQPN
jgi:hypothetical protein